MLYRAAELKHYHIRARDGDMGSVKDIYFEDTNWMIRYIVADTGSWLTGRRTLLSPYSAGQPDDRTRSLPVDLNKEQVRNSPDIEADKPVSRQHEHALHTHYGWPIYWGHPSVVPGYTAVSPKELELPSDERHFNIHLHSSNELKGYRIDAIDGEFGRVDDIVLGTAPWKILYLLVDTGGALTGKKSLIPTEWVTSVLISELTIYVDVSREQIRNSPEYDYK